MIHINNVSKSFRKVHALKNIFFKVQKGEIVGFLGQNGSGKTTLMRIITTYLLPSSGQVLVDGEDVLKNPLAVRQKIGYLPETPPLYLNMSVYGYLKFSAQLKNVPVKDQKTQIERVLRECHLTGVQKRIIGQLSKGYKQRVGIAQAIIHNPEILILDEPTSGLDPVQVRQVRGLIQGLEQKRTVLLSTHILSEIENLAQRVVMIKSGGIIADEPMANLLVTSEGKQRSLEEAFFDFNGVDDE